MVRRRPTTPAGRGTPTPATAARRPGCSCGRSSGRCPTCGWPASRSTSDVPCRWPGSRSRPRSCGPAGRPATAGPPSSTPTARCGPRRRACTSRVSAGAAVPGAARQQRRRHAPPGRGRARRVPDRARRPRPARLPPRRRGALPARRGQRPRGHDGVDADGPAAARRGAVAVPAHQPAGRLRQRLQPPRRTRSGAVRQHRPRHRPAPRSRRRVDGQPCRRRPGSRRVSGWPTRSLFDDEGPVGRALQTLLLRPVG